MSNIIKFWLPYQFQRFLYQTLCVFSQIKENILNRIFILLLGLCPWVGLGGAGGGGSKTLAWGFAMVPYRLRILVSIWKEFLSEIKFYSLTQTYI